MPNLVEVNYGQTKQSTNTDALGMREMQAKAFAARDAQYLLIKSPPASGKSRALMMEQVLAPSFNFKTKKSDDDASEGNILKIRGLKQPTSRRVKDIIESDLNDLKATILNDDRMQKAMPGNVDPEVINKVLIPKIIQTKYPDLTDDECEQLRQHVVVDSVIKGATIEETGDRRIIRMASLKKDSGKIKELADLDEFNLLTPEKPIESINDILNDDDLNILGSEVDDDIFTLKHVPQYIESPDYVARRKPCEQFDDFKMLFKQCHADLTAGKRKLHQFANEQQIREGHFFILRGVMCYVAEVGEKERKKGKVNARMRCIFENGTESDMLLRSLARELYKDGRRISEHDEHLPC